MLVIGERLCAHPVHYRSWFSPCITDDTVWFD